MMFEPVIEGVLGSDGPRFSAYAMFYGGCMVDFDDFRVEGSPAAHHDGRGGRIMSIPACEAFRDRLQALGVDVQLEVYPGAGHGWDNPYPQRFVEGAVVTRDCLMHWTESGEVVETSSGHSMDNALGAIRAMRHCSHDRGYTMGRNEPAHRQSLLDLEGFLRRSWSLPSP